MSQNDSMAAPARHGGDSTANTAVEGLVIVLAVICVALRFWIRIFTNAGLAWDDWLVFAAALCTLATAILLLVGNAIDPVGLWVSDNTDPDYLYSARDVSYLKLSFASSILYFAIAGSTKTSILFMYHRLFAVDRSFLLVLAFWFGCTVAAFANCIPLKWSWLNGLADPRYCFNYNLFWMAAGAGEVGLDALILALPIRMVLTLHLSARKKITIVGIFPLGGFVLVTGIVKVILGYPANSRVPSYAKTEVWTTVHAGMSIVCACLPIFKPLISRISHSSLFSRLSHSARRMQYGSGSRRWSSLGMKVWRRRSQSTSRQRGTERSGETEVISHFMLDDGGHLSTRGTQKSAYTGTAIETGTRHSETGAGAEAHEEGVCPEQRAERVALPAGVT